MTAILAAVLAAAALAALVTSWRAELRLADLRD